MKLEDCYKIGEERIGQYDGYLFHYKRWLTVLSTGLIYAAYLWPNGWWILGSAGVVGVGLVFLLETSLRATSGRILRYCKKLEDEMMLFPGGKVKSPGLWLSSLSIGWWETWRECGRALWPPRAGAVIPHIIVAGILFLGTYVAGWVGESQGKDQNSSVQQPTSALVTETARKAEPTGALECMPAGALSNKVPCWQIVLRYLKVFLSVHVVVAVAFVAAVRIIANRPSKPKQQSSQTEDPPTSNQSHPAQGQ